MSDILAVVGSRLWPKSRYQEVIDYIAALDPDMIVSGGAVGVDSLAIGQAIKLCIPKRVIEPKYRFPNDREAPLLRNTEIAELCTRMVAFQFNNSSGTADVIEKARRFGKPVIVIT